MADALTCIKDPGELLSAFNKRLKAECDKFEPTRVQLTIIDGEPMVTLLAETVEADEDDVEDAKDHGATINDDKGNPRPIALGDEIPAGDLVTVKLVKVAAFETPKREALRKGTPTEGMKASEAAESHLDKVYERAKGLITDHIHASGPTLNPEYAGQQVHYIAVVYVEAEDDAEAAQVDAAGEAALRSP
jgi:hypothetical protein